MGLRKLIAANIKRIRAAKGMNQQELADKLSVSSQTINRYENGHTTPDDQALSDMANILECKPQDFYSNNEFVLLDDRSIKAIQNTLENLLDKGLDHLPKDIIESLASQNLDYKKLRVAIKMATRDEDSPCDLEKDLTNKHGKDSVN